MGLQRRGAAARPLGAHPERRTTSDQSRSSGRAAKRRSRSSTISISLIAGLLWLKISQQVCVGVSERRGDGALADAAQRGDICVKQVGEVPQEHHQPSLGRQSRQRLGQEGIAFG
jgi:hypothetical protein